MSLRTGSQLGPYRLLRDFVAGANCRWTFAERNGREFFIKEFQTPKHPPDALPGPLHGARLIRCRAFEDRHRRLLAALRHADAGATLVVPVEFFRHELAYYHVAPRVAPSALSPRQIGSARDRLLLIRALAGAVTALHKVRVVHGDLKPSNVLIDRAANGSLSPRLIDFDGAYFAGEAPEPDDMEFDQAFMAPEVLGYVRQSANGTGPRPGLAADIFSLGLLIHAFWAGCAPSPAGHQTYPAEAVASGDGLRLLTQDMDVALEPLLRRALSADPSERPAARELEVAAGIALGRLGALAPAASQAGFGPADPFSGARTPGRPRAEVSEGLAALTATARSGSFGVVIRKSANLKRHEP